MSYNSQTNINKLWEKCPEVRGKDSDLYRKGANGDVIYKNSYGKNSQMGFQVDHIKPKSRGGSDCIVNLQLVNSHYNMSKGASLVKASHHSTSNKKK